MTLVVQPEAESDIVEALVWYDAKDKAVRERFAQAIEATFEVVDKYPLRYQRVFGQVRRIMVAGFPYALLYVAHEQHVNVIACFHCSRDPSRWHGRLR